MFIPKPDMAFFERLKAELAQKVHIVVRGKSIAVKSPMDCMSFINVMCAVVLIQPIFF